MKVLDADDPRRAGDHPFGVAGVPVGRTSRPRLSRPRVLWTSPSVAASRLPVFGRRNPSIYPWPGRRIARAGCAQRAMNVPTVSARTARRLRIGMSSCIWCVTGGSIRHLSPVSKASRAPQEVPSAQAPGALLRLPRVVIVAPELRIATRSLLMVASLVDRAFARSPTVGAPPRVLACSSNRWMR